MDLPYIMVDVFITHIIRNPRILSYDVLHSTGDISSSIVGKFLTTVNLQGQGTLDAYCHRADDCTHSSIGIQLVDISI